MASSSTVSSSRFKTLLVTAKTSIKQFVTEQGLKFKTGRGFYQLSKKEDISAEKEVIVQNIIAGTFLTGDAVRAVLKLPTDQKISKFKVDASLIPDFRVFVQSTSVNRALVPNTWFLYEGEGDGDDDDAVPAKKGGGKKKAPASKRKTSSKKEEEDEEEEEEAEEEEEEEEEKPAKKGKTAATLRKGIKKGKSKMAVDGEDDEAEVKEDTASPTVMVPAPAPAVPSSKAEVAAAPAGIPFKNAGQGGKVEIVFSFDTTGSMYPCLTQVRKSISETVARLITDVPNIRIGIVAHGDYGDAASTYTIKTLDFTSNKTTLTDFVNGIGATCGYDGDECYELVLRDVQELSWSSECQMRSLVLIGDSNPHTNMNNPFKIDWRAEAKKLAAMQVKVYAVQALSYGHATPFYKELASLTGGFYLNLSQFASITDFVLAIAFREHDHDQVAAYEAEVRSKGGMNVSLHQLFDTILGRAPTAPTLSDAEQKAGKGFYEFTKSETISSKKEIVLMDKATGAFFSGKEAGSMIGLIEGGPDIKLKPVSLDKYRIFVQSTSYNRVLMPGTGFLYEVDDTK